MNESLGVPPSRVAKRIYTLENLEGLPNPSGLPHVPFDLHGVRPSTDMPQLPKLVLLYFSFLNRHYIKLI